MNPPRKSPFIDYPDKVVGMVLIDSSHEEEGARVQATLDAASADENPGARELRAMYALPIDEGRNYIESDKQVRAARKASGNTPLLRDSPLVVLTPALGTNSNEWPTTLPEGVASRLDLVWMELQEDTATLSSNSKLVIVEESGHDIEVDQPAVVVEAIRQVVEAVRTGTPLE